jgi:hypothetical protein
MTAVRENAQLTVINGTTQVSRPMTDDRPQIFDADTLAPSVSDRALALFTACADKPFAEALGYVFAAGMEHGAHETREAFVVAAQKIQDMDNAEQQELAERLRLQKL